MLIVVAIIGLLASIAFPYYGQYKQRAYDVHARANLKTFWLTCNLYWQDNPNGTCNIAAVTNTTYGFSTAVDVTLIAQGTKTSFSGTTSHNDSPTTFSINSTGNLS
jgi:Tfp pilus assembly protein PilE